MMIWEDAWMLLFILMPIAAFLYASVGHGGASSYLMFLALFNFAPEQIRENADAFLREILRLRPRGGASRL
jgi:hypothetical protein